MTRVALFDTNLAAAPIHAYLVEAGHEVFVIGGNPDDYLARSVSSYIQLDYSDEAAAIALVDQLGVSFIVPGCNDRSYLTCAAIAEARGFPGIDSVSVTDALNNKQAFRQFAWRQGIPIPRVWSADDLPNHRPLIVKPVDAYSGRGITVLHSTSDHELTQAIGRAQQSSKSGQYLIEDFVSGQLYSHTAFIANGQIRSDHIVEEHGSANPFTVDTSCVRYDLAPAVLESIRRDIASMARALQLVDGLVHTQFILHENQYWFVEVTRRCPGDLYSLLIQFSTGAAYAENYARPFLGQPFDFSLRSAPDQPIMRHTLSQPVEQVFNAINFHQDLQIERYYPLSRAGDLVAAAPFGRIGLLFANAKTKPALDGLMTRTVQRDLYSITSA
jgi:biotin carboxylase